MMLRISYLCTFLLWAALAGPAGTRQGMAISWPGHITDKGGIRNQFHHVIDVVPTLLEVSRNALNLHESPAGFTDFWG